MENLTFIQLLLFVVFCLLFVVITNGALVGTWFLLRSFIHDEQITTIITIPFGILIIAFSIWCVNRMPDNLWIF